MHMHGLHACKRDGDSEDARKRRGRGELHSIEVVFRCKVCMVEVKTLDAARLHASACKPHYKGVPVTAVSFTSSEVLPVEVATVKSTYHGDAPIIVSIIVEEETSILLAKERESLSDGHESIITNKPDDEDEESFTVNVKIGTKQPPISRHSALDSAYLYNKPKTTAIQDDLNGDSFALESTKVPIPVCYEHCNADILKNRRRVMATQEGIIKCMMCDYTHVDYASMKSHILTHTDIKAIKCTECEMTFCNKQTLSNHCRLHHLGGNHLCDVCGHQARSKFSLLRHKLKCSSNTFKCRLCEFITDNGVDLNEHTVARHLSRFVCKRCNDKCGFDSKQGLVSHMEEYHPGKSCYFCDKCNFVAKLQNELHKHYMMHTDERPCRCTVDGCTFSTRNATYLKYHIAKVHKANEFICKHCCFVTNARDQLDLHVTLRHMKTYKCSKCDFEGKSTTALRRHRLRKHVDHNDMRFKCTVCNYHTQFRDCIIKHLLTHEISSSRHRCAFCKLVLTCRDDLKAHLLKFHADCTKNVLFCDKCCYSTTRSSNLKVHISRKHSVTEPFKCSLCDYTSKCKIYLKLHTARKHTKGISNDQVRDGQK